MFGRRAPAPPPTPTSLYELEWNRMVLVGLLLLLVVLLGVAARLAGVRTRLLPATAAHELGLLRKAALVAYGASFLVLSRDNIGAREAAAAARAADEPFVGGSEREVRLIFVRHGESVWNYVFNRGFGPSFLVRLVRVTLHELCLLPFDDSAYIDSPLSELGLEQCEALRSFLGRPCVDPAARSDFAALTSGESYSLVVSSQLRRAASTVAIALSERLRRSAEPVVLASALQEISRNFDTMALAAAAGTPRRDAALEVLAPGARFDGSANEGNKSLSFRGLDRVQAFAKWAAERPERTIIVGGHSLWFRSFFAVFLPASVEHLAKKRKIVNCGVVGLTLQVGRGRDGRERYRVDPTSIGVVYGGFSPK